MFDSALTLSPFNRIHFVRTSGSVRCFRCVSDIYNTHTQQWYNIIHTYLVYYSTVKSFSLFEASSREIVKYTTRALYKRERANEKFVTKIYSFFLSVCVVLSCALFTIVYVKTRERKNTNFSSSIEKLYSWFRRVFNVYWIEIENLSVSFIHLYDSHFDKQNSIDNKTKQ